MEAGEEREAESNTMNGLSSRHISTSALRAVFLDRFARSSLSLRGTVRAGGVPVL